MTSCIFCKMVSGEIQVTKTYEDDDTIAIRDINPAAPFHVLVIPKMHFATPHEVSPDQTAILGSIFNAVREIVKQENLSGSGYRLVMNAGEQAGQSVAHLHMHILSGRTMHWPPG